MAAFLDVCRFNPTAGGTTDWTYSSAVTGFQSPSAAGVVNGKVYRYRAESADLTQWEVGYGAYNTSTGVLARTTVLFNSAGTTSKINFSAAPQVAIVALAEDLAAMVATVSQTVITSSGNYTPPAGFLFGIVECLGAGAGGGGAQVGASVAGQYGGGGAGAGSYSRKRVTLAQIQADASFTAGHITVTIGANGTGGTGTGNGTAGGDTSFGALCIGKGGSPGMACHVGQFGTGGAGGIAGTGDFAAPGGNGGTGPWSSLSPGAYAYLSSGYGGPSQFGGGGIAVQDGTGAAHATNGGAGSGYGAGGAGAIAQSPNTSGAAASGTGGNGSPGVIVITEYCGPVG